MKKCDPRAFARCPHRKQCSDSPEHTSFYAGTECDYFNHQVINKPMTNADSIRAMSDEELAKFLCEFRSCDSDGHPCSGCKAESYCRPGHTGMEDWLQQPADGEEDNND